MPCSGAPVNRSTSSPDKEIKNILLPSLHVQDVFGTGETNCGHPLHHYRRIPPHSALGFLCVAEKSTIQHYVFLECYVT